MREDEARSMKRTHHMMCNAAKYEYARFKNACRLIRRGSVKRAGTTISTILLTLNNRHKKLFCSNFFFLRVPCICCIATSAQQNEYACQSLYCFNGIGLLCVVTVEAPVTTVATAAAHETQCIQTALNILWMQRTDLAMTICSLNDMDGTDIAHTSPLEILYCIHQPNRWCAYSRNWLVRIEMLLCKWRNDSNNRFEMVGIDQEQQPQPPITRLSPF